jgi:hypothetical protein
MNYEKIYQDFYSKYYDKAEFFAKRFFIKRHSQKKTYLTVLNEATFFLNDNYICVSNIHTNENLRKLHRIFCNRYSIYAVNQIQEIFENEIKIGFDKLKISELPKNYNYNLFIKEITLFEALKEISRLLSNYSRLFEMMYKLNDFDDFEIRTQGNLSVEDFPVYKKLSLQLYPENQNHFIENEKIILPKTKSSDLKMVSKSEMNRNHWNENCFDLFYYLVDNYEKKGKIKFINIFYFLKNDVDKKKYAFGFTIDQYKNFILLNFEMKITKFERAEYEYFDKVIPILNGFEQDFRSIV